MNTALNWIDWTVIAGYLVFAFAVGLIFAKRAGSSTNEFFISGRNLPWWLAGTSMVATSFSSDTPLVITGWVRAGGVSENWLWWSLAIGGMLSVFLLAKLWRRAEVVTDVELTELRYSGKPAAALRAFRAAYLALPINCITMAWVIVAMVKLMKVLFGFHPLLAVVVCVGVTTFYCVLSGFWGVVVTDFIQFIIAMAGSIGLCVVVVRNFDGLSDLSAQAQLSSPLHENVVRFFPRPPDGTGPLEWAFWSGPMFAFVVFLSVQWWANKNADGGGVVVQRMSSAKDERHSLLATLWFNIANYALRPWPWILVALASIVVFPDLKDGETAYPEMIKRFVPAGLLGLILTSFLAAFMSTIDTILNLSSSYLVNDVYRRFVQRKRSEKHYVAVSRLSSLGFMVISSVIALRYDSISGLFKFMLAFSSGIGGVYILRWFWWRINAWSEISAMLASSLISSLLYIFKSPLGDPSYPVILTVTVAGSTLVWLATTFITAPVTEDKLIAFYRKVRPYGAWGRIARLAGQPPVAGLGQQIVNWIAGTVMVLAYTLSAGKFLLAQPGQGAIYLVAALLGTIVVWKAVRPARPVVAQAKSAGKSLQPADSV
jgi:Na+/proline symporter